MENVDKRKHVKIVDGWESNGRRLGARALIAKSNFHSISRFTDDLIAIQMTRARSTHNKPICLGFFVLELSKWKMHDFQYNYIDPKFTTNLSLTYMDTDSFICSIRCDDFYNDIRNDIDSKLTHLSIHL